MYFPLGMVLSMLMPVKFTAPVAVVFEQVMTLFSTSSTLLPVPWLLVIPMTVAAFAVETMLMVLPIIVGLEPATAISYASELMPFTETDILSVAVSVIALFSI